jgi:ABC-2 type transport system ATP-binding protein
MQTVLQTRELSKRYDEFYALDAVSLTLRQGDIYGLIGRNGAGKTTFFKCVLGLARPTGGTIEILGEKNNLNAMRKHVGFMINPAFFPYLNARMNLEYLARVKGLRPDRGAQGGSGNRAQDEIDRLLELVGLVDVSKPYKAFSLGMKHRLGIAAALLGSPSIVVLDEPINGLDPQGILDMRAVIKNIPIETGATVIVSSHILSELDLVATQFGFIEQGVLLKEITHSDLHEQTERTLLVEVSNAAKALTALQAMGISAHKAKATTKVRAGVHENASDNLVGLQSNRLIINSHLNRAHDIARALINADIDLFELRKQETTLEDYFIRLIGEGGKTAARGLSCEPDAVPGGDSDD